MRVEWVVVASEDEELEVPSAGDGETTAEIPGADFTVGVLDLISAPAGDEDGDNLICFSSDHRISWSWGCNL